MNDTIKKILAENQGIASPAILAALILAEPLNRICTALESIPDAIASLESEIHCH